jgi:putative transposase
VKIRYRYRLYPTPEQEKYLAREFGAARYAYNWALRLRSDAFRDGVRLNDLKTSAAWTKERRSLSWALETSCVPPQQALRHLQTAFVNFFEKRAEYPSFKKKARKQNAEYTRSAFQYDPETRLLSFAKLGAMKVRWSRAFVSEPTTATITKSPSGRYHVTLCLDEPEPAHFPKTGNAIGVDLGLNRLATLSNGERIANPRFLGKRLKDLAHLQRDLSRRKKGSGRWNRARIKVARLQEKISDTREDQIHKVTLDLVRRFDFIAIEDLHVRGMSKLRSLARSVSDAGLGMFRTFLEYKAKWYGKEALVIDRWYPSSKTCSACGWIKSDMTMSTRQWICKECGVSHDRDDNAAKNILAVGQTVTARGGGVRLKRTPVRKSSPRRSVKQPRAKV